MGLGMSKGLWATASAAALAAFLAGTVQASAHAISIGFTNSGPGSVTVWLGTYAHGGHHLEGSASLLGVLGTIYPLTLTPFGTLTADGLGAKPAGLIDGTNNFFSQWDENGSIPFNLPLVGSPADFYAGCPGCGPVQHWEGALFTGLTEGDYEFKYVPIANPSQEWEPLSSTLEGVFHLGAGVVNPTDEVPEPLTLTLFGAGVVGLAALRRRKAKRA